MASASINYEHDDDNASYHIEITADVRSESAEYFAGGTWQAPEPADVEIRTVLVNKIVHYYGSSKFERVPCRDEAEIVAAWLKADVLPACAAEIEAKLAAAV